jgi:hypothetical protein
MELSNAISINRVNIYRYISTPYPSTKQLSSCHTMATKTTEDNDHYPRYTDILKAEIDRQMSLVSTPITLALSDTRGNPVP